MRSFHLVSLGCAKNLVDSELMIGSLMQKGWEYAEVPEEADLLLLNTCGFIQPAVEEAVDEILGLARIKQESAHQKLVVTGCLVQRYRQTLLDELPEVDLFIGTEGYRDVAERIEALYREKIIGNHKEKLYLPPRFLMDSSMPRILTTPSHRAWFKITEGCNNRCSYCMIPSIRGELRSRPVDDLLVEANLLEQHGVKELSIIAQDITAYGDDLGTGTNLPVLLEKLLERSSIPWIRLLYLYPTGIDDRLLELVADQPRILPYFDIPFQHVSDRILQSMNRHHTGEDLYKLVDNIRGYLPDAAIRTTFLVGFPGETESDVQQLHDFLKSARLDHVGVFPYANEDGCPSEHFPHQVEEEEREARRDGLLAVQAEISAEKLKKYVGRKELVLVEGVSSETDLLLEGRTRFQAPEVDGCVYINDGTARAGDMVTVEITESQVYDLVGAISQGA